MIIYCQKYRKKPYDRTEKWVSEVKVEDSASEIMDGMEMESNDTSIYTDSERGETWCT